VTFPRGPVRRAEIVLEDALRQARLDARSHGGENARVSYPLTGTAGSRSCAYSPKSASSGG
jgi:hypothetical protein